MQFTHGLLQFAHCLPSVGANIFHQVPACLYFSSVKEIKIFGTAFTKNDIWVLAFVFPYYIIYNYVLLGPLYFSSFPIAITATAAVLPIWPVSWYIHTIAGFKVRSSYPEIRQTAKRVILSLCVFIPITWIQNILIVYFISGVPMLHFTVTAESIKSVCIAGLVLNIIATAIFEATYLVNKWKSSLIETEEFKKAYLQSELDNLKSQVNPHFLFNSINSLSSLINEDTDKAEKFLREMSKVYRYLLQNNDQELTPLRVELDFINSYYHLLKTRYETGISMQVSIDDKYHQYLIPPLTLQMLIENAVKHNVILEKSPLHIRLMMDDSHEHLIVQNNIQKKTTAIESNKIGLKNIKAKYRLLNQDEVIVEERDNNFTVIIPLVKNN